MASQKDNKLVVVVGFVVFAFVAGAAWPLMVVALVAVVLTASFLSPLNRDSLAAAWGKGIVAKTWISVAVVLMLVVGVAGETAWVVHLVNRHQQSASSDGGGSSGATPAQVQDCQDAWNAGEDMTGATEAQYMLHCENIAVDMANGNTSAALNEPAANNEP
jgi:hypothetical protein